MYVNHVPTEIIRESKSLGPKLNSVICMLRIECNFFERIKMLLQVEPSVQPLIDCKVMHNQYKFS